MRWRRGRRRRRGWQHETRAESAWNAPLPPKLVSKLRARAGGWASQEKTRFFGQRWPRLAQRRERRGLAVGTSVPLWEETFHSTRSVFLRGRRAAPGDGRSGEPVRLHANRHWG